MDLVVFFEQPPAGLVSVAGGKGSNLSALTRGGFPVPPGFVITAAAYEHFLAAVPWLDAELDRLTFDDPDILRAQCTRLRARLGAVPLPAGLDAAVRAGLARLGEGPVAVRSSSTFEDLAQAAFAGQHDTYLNVRGPDAVCDRVRACFLSLWEDRAVLYRRRQGFSQRQARMAVVVQRQVACDRAGVGFSIDPVSGRLDRLVLSANYGLGESVVAGEGEVDCFTLDKRTLEVVGRSIGHKERMVLPTADGVAERPVPPGQADAPCLDDGQIRTVAEMLRRVEAHYGWPQDVEWGWQGGTLHLFQSRPVTTFPPRWTRDESAERFPNPVTPLSWDLFDVAFKRSLAYSLDLMGLPALEADLFGLFDHHVYGNQNVVELIAGRRPLRARTLEELAAEVPELRRRYAWVLDLPVSWARDLDRYLVRLGRLSAAPVEQLDFVAACTHLAELLEVAVEYFRPNLAITMVGGSLHRLLHALVALVVGPERALEVVDGLLAGCETKTVLVNRELHELAVLAGQTPDLARRLGAEGGQAVWREGGVEAYPAFAARLRRFLEDHGHRELDMDPCQLTWAGQPGVVLDAVGLILRSGAGENPQEAARRQRARYAATEHRFLNEVPEELRFFFRELIRLARTYTALDDLEHYQTTRLHPVVRRAALAVGRCLAERGVLDRPDDVFFCRRSDLEALVTEYTAGRAVQVRQRVEEARRSFAASGQQTPSWSLAEGEGEKAEGGQTYRGLPGSPGRVTGPCFRLQGAEDFARFPRGAVLVARTTNPAWTPLFYSAAGLITESGGPLSHGAVTAREMRLPAVMSVRGAMSLFVDGQVVTVDGTQGIVRIESADAGA